MDIPDLKINVITNPGDISAFWDWLTHRPRDRNYVACDIETGAAAGDTDPKGALHWYKPGHRVRMMQFGDAQGGWAFPYEGWPDLAKGAFEQLQIQRTTHVWHNGMDFDYKSLWMKGIKLDHTLMEDTFIWAGLRGYAEDSRRLKPLGGQELGAWAEMGSEMLSSGMKNAGWDWTTVPMSWSPYPVYGVMDTCITALLWEKWEADREKFGRQHELEIAAAMHTNQMSINGMTMDGSYLHIAYKEHKAKADELHARAQELGMTSPAKTQEALEILKAANVLDENITTDGGLVSVNKKQLVGIGDRHPLAKVILEYRWENRVADTYLKKLWDMIGNVDGLGIVHPSIWSMEARTHRMSVSDPPVQQFPANDPTVRNACVPREPGHVLISADYGQIEMRLWASLNGDQALMDTLNEADATGEDFFVIMARQLFKEPGFQKKDKRRGPIKNTSYATIYGGGVDRIAMTAGLPVEEVKPIIFGLRQLYPSFADGGQKAIEVGDGGVAHAYTPTGRQFAVRTYGEQRKLPNYRVQGHAAEVLKGAMIGCGAAGLGPNMVLAVHDELIFSVPQEDAPDAAQEIKIIMDAQCPKEQYGVAITASPVIASRWSGLKD